MPTRVIDVGIGRDRVRLISTDKLRQGIHYVALSHCWGKLTKKQKKKWRTTRRNKKRRSRRFFVKQLPPTFQDAIRVTREIGKRYLWIDSLCIIQGDDGDWATEATKMETVFKNAYCTIAATSAEDSTVENDILETVALDDTEREVLGSNPFDQELIQYIGLSGFIEHIVQDILSIITFGVDAIHRCKALRSGDWLCFIAR